MFKVSPEIEKKLLNLPESGMGYQIVDATYRDGSVKESLILNATVSEPVNNRNVQQLLAAMMKNYSESLYKYSAYSTEIIDVKLKTDRGSLRAAKCESSFTEATTAEDAPSELTKRDERFARFSAYEDDKRIDKANKRVLPGTYATTFADASYCISQKVDPRDRYALPNPELVKFVFHISPIEKTQIKRGKVKPNFGLRGGGDEVIFPIGTTHNTVKMASL